MEINVPKGQRLTLNFKLTPTLPIDGQAGDWQLICEQAPELGHVKTLDFVFDSRTPMRQRRNELATLVIELDEAIQTKAENWRFMAPGMVFAPDDGDDKDCFSCRVDADMSTLNIDVCCLDNDGETFKFSFLAMYTDVASGECRILASADPGGSAGRKP